MLYDGSALHVPVLYLDLNSLLGGSIENLLYNRYMSNYPYSTTCSQVHAFSLAPGLGLAALFTPLAMSKIRSVVTLLGPLYQCQHLRQRKGFEG